MDAERWLTGIEHSKLTGIEHSKLTGGYIDLSLGKVTFQAFAERWRKVQVHRSSTLSRPNSNCDGLSTPSLVTGLSQQSVRAGFSASYSG